MHGGDRRVTPDLFRVRARTPEQMRLANAFCRFAELAAARSRWPQMPEPDVVLGRR
jgi:hypothetical protein